MIPGRALLRIILTAWIVTACSLFAASDEATVCAACHAKETAAYLKSPMGNSIAPPSPLPGARVARTSGIEISIGEREGRMIHSLSSNGLSAEHPVAYQIGAGKIGYTYIIRIRDYLFESPASWYRGHGWDVSPGYERMASIDFDRSIDSTCLFCHADSGKFLGSDGRRFSGEALNPIGCDRCHGLADEHVRHPSAKNIVNPSKLAPRARNSVCEQCHLEGETRVLNPGKTWQDFHAGDELERTAVTYLLTKNNQEVRAVAQPEQLALSKCVRASGSKLWCATCHNPHGGANDRANEIREVCSSCHSTLSKTAHPAVTECVSCHMPRLTPQDIPHTASTDHRILRRPAPLPDAAASGAEIAAWKDPPSQFRARDLAVAALVIGGTHSMSSLRETGVQLLEALPQTEKENDPAVLSSLVSIRLQRRQPEQAKEFARRAAELQPDSGFASLNLALALQNSGDDEGAERQLLHTIGLDPSLQPAWVNLAFLYEKQGRQRDRIAILDRYLGWNPQNIWFRQLKGTQSQQALTTASTASGPSFEALAAQAAKAREANNTSQAIHYYRQALQLNPAWVEGWWFLGTLSYDTDQYESGRQAFAEFVKLDQKAAPGWSFLGLCEFETGEYAHALEHIRRALDIGAGLEPAVEQVLRFHEALALTRLGLFDRALPKFMPFVRRGLHNPEMIAGLGLTALRQPLLPKEVAAGEHELVVAAGQTAYLWMGGDNSKTAAAFHSLITDYPKAPGVHYLYATYLLSFRPAEEALLELKHELEVNPRSADARATIALLMVRAGASSAAAPYARQAAQDGPTSPMAQYTYGLILAATGDLRQAIERLEAAERLDPGNIEYHIGLAGAYSKAGRHAEARRERQTSITLAKESDSHGPG